MLRKSKENNFQRQIKNVTGRTNTKENDRENNSTNIQEKH